VNSPFRSRALATCAAAAVLVGGSIAAVATADTPSSGAQASAGQATQAETLARQIVRADTTAERLQALRGVMATVGIGVYRGNGTRLVAGSEYGTDDFYLYDFELKSLAGALGRGARFNLKDLAEGLSSLRDAGDPKLGAAALRKALADGINSAQAAPDEELSLVPLIVDELGTERRRNRVRLASGTTPLREKSLDALQRFLIVADVALPLLRSAQEREATAASGASASLTEAPPETHPCANSIGENGSEFFRFGKWGLGLIKRLGTPAKLAGPIIDGIHGSILAFSVYVDMQSKSNQTLPHYGHYGPNGHKPAEWTFTTRVIMLDDLGQTLTKCGWMAGVEFPPKGPLDRVHVVWFEGTLPQYGTVRACGRPCKFTNQNGVATLEWIGAYDPCNRNVPRSCAGGTEDHIDTVTSIAQYLSRFGNVLGYVAQTITPKFGVAAWSIEYHRFSCKRSTRHRRVTASC
jgi:hypothetical protein